MTEAQTEALANLKHIIQAGGPQAITITPAGANIYVEYSAPVTVALVIFPNGSLYFVGEPDDDPL